MQDPRWKLWDDFLSRWPVSAVESMTIDEYGDASTRDSFSYWLEIKLRQLGSIAGGAAFKFGVYRRASNDSVVEKQGRRYDEHYGWYGKLGDSAQEAFQTVKTSILHIITNVQAGNLDAIDADSTLGTVVKWKIAFLYQNRDHIICPLIYNEDRLRFGTGLEKSAPHVDLVRTLMANYDQSDSIFKFCERVWEEYDKQFVDWFPKDYSPGFTVEDWVSMLNDREIFRDPEDLKVMKRMKHFGGEATCQQLAKTYGGNFNHYNATSAYLAKRIHEKTNCPVYQEGEEEHSRWWPILYLGHNADKDTPGTFVWKLRPELSEALDQVNLDQIDLYEQELEKPEVPSTNDETEEIVDVYDYERLYQELWMTRNDVDALVRLIKHKKNVILQGAPGVGKTYTAKRLAYALMGEVDETRVKMIQFHQNYSYEDFIMGYKPTKDGFELRYGVFYEFCQKAAQEPQKEHFFIIDEINRGNLSKILGELMMLIERDHRDESLVLAYDGKPFAVPSNVYIIGMMNTADRSLALIDYALRRRFSFFEISPGFDTDGFKAHQSAIGNDRYNELIKTVKALNDVIVKDDSLGSGFQIAHSYFCKPEAVEGVDSWLKEIVQYDLLPTLSEYWFDDHDCFNEWKRKLTDAVNGE